jgi:hypothetical protein
MLACIVLLCGGVALILVAHTDSTSKSSKKTLPKKRYSRI